VVDAAGTACACADSFQPQPETTSITELVCNPQAIEAAKAVNDNATTASGTWVMIPVLANDHGSTQRISALSKPSVMGGRARIVRNVTGMDAVRYLSKAGFTGIDSFNYTTPDGTAVVTVSVTPGSCLGSKCGLLGSCNAGACSCAADSGMLPTFVTNPNTTTRTTTPRVPACRYPGDMMPCRLYGVALAVQQIMFCINM
jgi:hypothetical protein